MRPINSLACQLWPFTKEEGSGQLHITSLCDCRVSSGQIVHVQGAIGINLMLIAENCDVLLCCSDQTLPLLHM